MTTESIPTKTVRKHANSKAAHVRKLLGRGKSPAEIAVLVGTTRNYVYGVSRRTKNKSKIAKGKPNWKTIALATSDTPIKRKPGRPRKSVVEFNPVTDLPPSLWHRIRALFA